MTEQTHPAGGVSQEMDDVSRVSAFLSQSSDPAKQEAPPKQSTPEATAAQPAEVPDSPAQSDELSPDDIPDDSAPTQPVADAFEIEIVHDGQQRKLTREEAIKYARQGFDYTQKTQAVAEKDRQIANQLRALAEVEQAQPYLLQERAQVVALEQQLGQWQNFNWVKLATDDPMGYPAARAQYDVLQQAYQQARGAFEHKEGQVKQRLSAIQHERVQAEYTRLPDLIPAWKDPAKREAGETELAKHYEATYGIPVAELAQSLNGSALAMSVAYKAMKYDQLLKNKASKDKQLRTAPPVTVPGAKSSNTKQDKERELFSKARKTGSLEDAAALLANRMLK